MKKFIYLLITTLILMSCGGIKKTTPSKYNPSFNYTPEQRSQITENSLSVAIIDPVYSDGENNTLVEPYASFVRNMADDIEESLNASGFKIKGPFKNRDEMVYGDKLNTDFAIEVEVQLYTESGSFGKTDPSFATMMYCETCYKLAGTFYHKGRIVLTATDPMDGEKFWKKNLELDRKAVKTQGNLTFDRLKGKLTEEAMLSDTGVYNPVAKVLESYYAETVSNMSRQIDPREMQQISNQIKAKRKRVGQ